MKEKLYFKTAEFAMLCGTTKDTLLHYDYIDLFKPHYTAENKYRYYHIKQVEEFLIINELKELGFSLEDIKIKLKKVTVDSYSELLEQKYAHIEHKINVLLSTKHFIQQHLEDIAHYKQVGLDNVVPVVKPTKYILMSQKMNNEDSPNQFINQYINRYTELMGRIKDLQQSTYCSYGSIKTREQVQNRSKYLYEYFYIQTTENLTQDYIPSGNYLVTYEQTDFEDVLSSYQRLLDYGKQNNIMLDDIFYEEVLVTLTSTEPKQYITQILCRVL